MHPTRAPAFTLVSARLYARPWRALFSTIMRGLRFLPLLLLAASCAGKPQLLRMYTPFQEDFLFSPVLAHVRELVYEVRRTEPPFAIVAFRPSQKNHEPNSSTEELNIKITRRDDGRAPVISITRERVIPATERSDERRVAAASRPMQDGRSILNIFLRY